MSTIKEEGDQRLSCKLDGRHVTLEEFERFIEKDERLWIDWSRFKLRPESSSALLRRTPNFDHTHDDQVVAKGVGAMLVTRTHAHDEIGPFMELSLCDFRTAVEAAK